MSSSSVAFRPGQAAPATQTVQASERTERRIVCVIWCLLLFNTMTFLPGITFVPIPSSIGKALAQAALLPAFLLALALNRRLIIRPNVFLCLATLLILGAVLTILPPPHFGTVFRTFRLALFIATLWLLTPWWGRRDLLLIRSHLVGLSIALGSVIIGLISPHYAFAQHRLTGALWPIPPTQVAHYAAVMIGLLVVLWLCGERRGKPTLIVVTLVGGMLVLTHTRTALVGMIAGIAVAGLSLIVTNARVRKLFAVVGAMVAVTIATLSSVLVTWLARGESTQGLTDLTGRTTVWSALVAYPRNKFEEIFGFGLSNSSFNGVSIDSNWLASYQEQGLYGVTVCVLMLLFLLVTAYFQPRGVQRALALFLVTYCLVASFTEVGFTDASPYLLELTLAASLLVPAVETVVPA